MIALLSPPAPKLRPIPPGLLYYSGVHCPACGGRQFTVRRITAECARCETALIVSRPHDEDENHVEA